MRPSSFVVLFLALLSVNMAGQERQPAAAPLHAEWLQSQSMSTGENPSTLQFYSDRGDPRDSEEVTCLKLRTYFVAREQRRSDVTRIVGYSTCQWSSKYAVKRAIGSSNLDLQRPR